MLQKSLAILLVILLGYLLTGCNLSEPLHLSATATTQPPSSTDFDCQASIAPWDLSWLLSENTIIISRIDHILASTELAGHGKSILQNASDYQVNPAFALAMFRKEANFAAPGTRANKNNNPGNIIATGECRGKPAGSSCSGVYGEVSTDDRFGVYPDMSAGIKAYFQLLNREYAPGSKRNCTDIPCIIQAYCPPSDCDTQNYISQITGWGIDYQCQLYAGSTTPSPTSTVTPTIEATPIVTPTNGIIPETNIWILRDTPNYVVSFDPQKWKITNFKVGNNEFSKLLLLSDNYCNITLPGPMGMPEDLATKNIGTITYDVVNRLEVDEPFMAYVAKNEIDPETQCHPFFFIYVPELKPEICISEAENVLSTLSKK